MSELCLLLQDLYKGIISPFSLLTIYLLMDLAEALAIISPKLHKSRTFVRQVQPLVDPHKFWD